MKSTNFCSIALALNVLFLITICSCKKSGSGGDYGCTDATALNYNAYAIHDDGSCQYNGSIVFWKNVPGGTVTLTLPDGSKQSITQTLTSAPVCNASGCYTYTNKPATYSFSATDGIHSWSGTVAITSAKCTPYVLSL